MTAIFLLILVSLLSSNSSMYSDMHDNYMFVFFKRVLIKIKYTIVINIAINFLKVKKKKKLWDLK